MMDTFAAFVLAHFGVKGPVRSSHDHGHIEQDAAM